LGSFLGSSTPDPKKDPKKDLQKDLQKDLKKDLKKEIDKAAPQQQSPPADQPSADLNKKAEASPSGSGVSSATSSMAPLLQPLAPRDESKAAQVEKVRQQAALDCQLSAWSEWSICRKRGWLKKGASQSRTREVLQPQLKGGAACPGALSEHRMCWNNGFIHSTIRAFQEA